MLVLTLLFASLAPLSAIAGTPGALRSLSGKDYSHHLKRTDEPFPARFSYTRRGPGSVPPTLKVPAEPVLVRRSPLSGVLLARQGCEQGSNLCPDGNACCPTGTECCTDASICCTSGSCCGNACCENGGVCCGTASGCCNAGNTCQTINGVPGCCATGQQCEAFVGCNDPNLVECAGETFCCPSGETCGRDPNGNATCNGQSASESQGVAASPTPGDTSIVNPSNTSSSSQASTTRRTSTSAAPTSTGSHTTTTPASTTSSSTGNGFSVMPSRDTFGLVGAVALVLIAFA
ncbi:hypothetical protein FRC18_009204 [Serendipita sp. 400]|nr:hypothetical protein FRC18_009204 [Serendipita sp. 400]